MLSPEQFVLCEQEDREREVELRLGMYLDRPTARNRAAWLEAEKRLSSPIEVVERFGQPIKEVEERVTDEVLNEIVSLFSKCGKQSPLKYAVELDYPKVESWVVLLIWSEHRSRQFWSKIKKYPLTEDEGKIYGRYVDKSLISPVYEEDHYTGLLHDYSIEQKGRDPDSGIGMLAKAIKSLGLLDMIERNDPQSVDDSV